MKRTNKTNKRLDLTKISTENPKRSGQGKEYQSELVTALSSSSLITSFINLFLCCALACVCVVFNRNTKKVGLRVMVRSTAT